MAARTSASSQTSVLMKAAAPPSSFATASPPAALTSASTMRAPPRAKRRALAAPRPEPAPVTRTTLSRRSIVAPLALALAALAARRAQRCLDGFGGALFLHRDFGPAALARARLRRGGRHDGGPSFAAQGR